MNTVVVGQAVDVDVVFTPVTPLGFHPDTLQCYALALSPCFLPMALARYRTLLMFFTSALTPRGSPGLCTDTLASTLSCPSVGGEQRRTPGLRLHVVNLWEEGGQRQIDLHTGHVAVTGAEGLQDELELPDSCGSLLSAAHVWLHHQLH